MEAVLVFLVYDEGDSHEDAEEYNDEEDHSHRATWICTCNIYAIMLHSHKIYLQNHTNFSVFSIMLIHQIFS